MSPRFAVMFKTHFWDAFTERQLNRLIQVNRSGDVFVVIDHLPVPVSKMPTRSAWHYLASTYIPSAPSRCFVSAGWPWPMSSGPESCPSGRTTRHLFRRKSGAPITSRRCCRVSARSISMIGGHRCTKVNLKITPTKPSFIRCLKETDMSGVFCGTKGASFPFLTLIARSGAGLPIKVPKVFVGNFAGNWARGVCVTFSESWKMPG
jgi:hypothetical protein